MSNLKRGDSYLTYMFTRKELDGMSEKTLDMVRELYLDYCKAHFHNKGLYSDYPDYYRQYYRDYRRMKKCQDAIQL